MLQIIGKTHIDFLRWRYWAFAFSGVLILMGVYGLVQIGMGKATTSVDFSGGTGMEVEFAKPVSAEQLRSALKHKDLQNVDQQAVREPGRYKYMLRITAPTLRVETVSAKVMEILKEKLADNTVTLLSSEDVGPTVSAHQQQQAIYAVFWAAVLILVYIWWRFDFRFAVAATVATFHDVLAVFGIFAVMNYEISWLLITALMTIAGYSLNDTIVIFDRIRENLRQRRKEEYSKLINDSVNETLSRTVITNFTVLMVILALYFIGGEVIHAFSFAMLLGAFIGTYSTVFVASAIVVEWNKRDPLPR